MIKQSKELANFLSFGPVVKRTDSVRARICVDWPPFAAGSAGKGCDREQICSTPWKVQNPGLGMDLVGKLWAVLCWAVCSSAAVHESQGFQVGQAGQSSSTCQHTCGLGHELRWVELSCNTHKCIQSLIGTWHEPDWPAVHGSTGLWVDLVVVIEGHPN